MRYFFFWCIVWLMDLFFCFVFWLLEDQLSENGQKTLAKSKKSLAKAKTICQLDVFGTRSKFSTIFQPQQHPPSWRCFFFSGRSKAKVRPTISKVRSSRTFTKKIDGPNKKKCVGKVWPFFAHDFFVRWFCWRFLLRNYIGHVFCLRGFEQTPHICIICFVKAVFFL